MYLGQEKAARLGVNQRSGAGKVMPPQYSITPAPSQHNAQVMQMNDTESTPRHPSYRDDQLHKHFKDLRTEVRAHPGAKAALVKVEQRLKYVLRVIETWDASHAERAETLIRLGNLEAANTAACLIFDKALRESILPRAPVTLDTGAAERMAEALELERQVIE